jgi:hypothetical protein
MKAAWAANLFSAAGGKKVVEFRCINFLEMPFKIKIKIDELNDCIHAFIGPTQKNPNRQSTAIHSLINFLVKGLQMIICPPGIILNAESIRPNSFKPKARHGSAKAHPV